MEELFSNAITRVPAMETGTGEEGQNGPRALTPDAELPARRDRRAGTLGRDPRLRARALRRGRDRLTSPSGSWTALPRVGRVAARPAHFAGSADIGVVTRSPAGTEALSQYYDIWQRRSRRDTKFVSAVYARHQQLDWWFREKGGWERVNWYQVDRGARRRVRCGRAGGRERTGHRRSRSKRARRARRSLSSTGRASRSSRYLVRARLRCSSGSVRTASSVRSAPVALYAQLLNERGGIEADLWVMRREEDRFLLVTGTAFGNHNRAWLEKNVPSERRSTSTTSPRFRVPLPLGPERARDVIAIPFDFRYVQAREVSARRRAVRSRRG